MAKKFFAIIAGVLMVFFTSVYPLWAEGFWKPANQFTISWDAYPKQADDTYLDIDGDAFPAGTTVSYKIYLVNASTDPDKTNPSFIKETPNVTETLTLNAKGLYYVGVTTIATVTLNGETLTWESDKNWSDVVDAGDANPFGIVRLGVPSLPTNLRDS